MFKSGNTDDLISLDQISEITLYLSIKLYTFIPVIPKQKTMSYNIKPVLQ